MRNKKAKDNGGDVFLLLYPNRISNDVSEYNIYIHGKWDDRLYNIDNDGAGGRGGEDIIPRIYGKFSGEGTDVSIPCMTTISACGSADSRISITSGNINKAGKLRDDEICTSINANSDGVL